MSPQRLALFVSRINGLGKRQCWEWTGGETDRHGRAMDEGSAEKAHRMAWRLFRGEIPGDAQVRHLCNNGRCINPYHLALGSHADNMQDKARVPRPPCSKISNKQVQELLSLRARGWKHKALAARFGISHTLSVRICLGERRQHVKR